MNFAHVSVLLTEAVDALKPERGGVFVDCTAGGGGHSEEILKRLPRGSKLISLDQDERAVLRCRERLAAYGTASTVIKANFSAIGEVLDGLGIQEIDGALWDLGVSSVQRRRILSTITAKKNFAEFCGNMEKKSSTAGLHLKL